MGFNKKKIVLAHILSLCIFSTMINSNVISISAENQINVDIQGNDVSISVQESDDNTCTTSIINNQDAQTTESVQTSIISKFDFEDELQEMIDTYKNLQEVQKAQAKEDTISFIDQLINSEEYSIDEKMELGNKAIYNAVFNDIFKPTDALKIKKDFSNQLDKLSEVDNLSSTIENILNSTVSIDTKKDFCYNVLDLSLLNNTISEDVYTSKLQEVNDTLEAQQQAENDRLAKEEADRLAKEEQARIEAEKLAQQQAEENAKAEELAKQQAEEQTQSVTTYSEPVQSVEDVNVQSTQIGFNGTISYSEKDFIALCNVVQHEVGNCSTLSKQMVASVVINRVLSGIFPNNIYDVVNQKNQFTGMSAFIDRTDYATEDTKYWCQYVLDNGVDYSNGALFYYAPRWCGYMSYFESMTLVAEHDGQRYFK